MSPFTSFGDSPIPLESPRSLRLDVDEPIVPSETLVRRAVVGDQVLHPSINGSIPSTFSSLSWPRQTTLATVASFSSIANIATTLCDEFLDPEPLRLLAYGDTPIRWFDEVWKK